MSVYIFEGTKDLGIFQIEAENLVDAIETLDFEMSLHDDWKVLKSEHSENKALILFNGFLYDIMEVRK